MKSSRIWISGWLVPLAVVMIAGRVQADESRRLITVVGAPGADEYEAAFDQWAKHWQAAAARAGVPFTRIGNKPGGQTDDRGRLEKLLSEVSEAPVKELWLVLIGHGTFDGEAAKFNLLGSDVTAAELNQWLDGAADKIIVINCASASGPFINRLAGPDRIVVTSTTSGYEFNFARFGQYMAEAIGDDGIDLDKDRQTSLLEAFIVASSKTMEFYETNSRLATEHALLEDNADARGTPGQWFRGIRATKTSKDGAPTDGLRANQVFLIHREGGLQLSESQRSKRDELELRLEDLRQQKSTMSPQQYEARLEPILVELATLYRDARSDSKQEQR